MFSKSVLIFFIVNFILDSYGQKSKKFFRSDYSYIEAVESFYKIHTIPLTWAEAKRVCALEGAIFWHPADDYEAQVLLSFWNKTKPKISYLYLGISDILVEGVFQTIDGKPISEVYSTWEKNEPNNAGDDEDCVHIDNLGYMNDCNCDKKYNFICKKTLDSLEWNSKCNMPNLDYTYSNDIGKCYKFHTTPLTWAEASAMCEVEHTSLATINNRLGAFYLVKLAESTPKPRINENYQRGIYHLGLHNRLSEGWQTIKGVPIDVDDDVWFDNYQPEGRKLCGSMFYTGHLIETDCNMKSFFICEHTPEQAVMPVSVSIARIQRPISHSFAGSAVLQPFISGGPE